MEALMNILNEIDDSVNWMEEKGLVDDRILDSFGVISLISELEDAFDIQIEAAEIIPENFNSVPAMWAMVTRLQENV